MKFGVPELILILVIVLIIFGAGKLPQLFDAVGQGVGKLRKRNDKDLAEAKKAEEEAKKVEEKKDAPAEANPVKDETKDA